MKTVFLTILLLLLPIAVQAIELGEKDNGKAIRLRIGEKLSVTLPGNPTTGYSWELTLNGRNILAPDAEPSYTPDSSLAGAGGRFTFGFTAREEGSSAARLVYRRPWEKDTEPLKSFGITVTVTKTEPEANRASYVSTDGKTMAASFDLKNSSVTVTLPGGRTVTLPAALSASGARYSSGAETFWEHQGSGRFFAGDTLLFEGKVSP